MSIEHWKIVEDKTASHWLELIDNEIGPDSIWWTASCTWDGCIHLHHYGNIPYNHDPERKDKDCCDDYIHICDLDEYIERLLALREMARSHFRNHHNYKESWGKRT